MLLLLLYPDLFITLFLKPEYNFEHDLCFVPCHSDSSYSLWFSPRPCSEVCYVPASLLDKPSWLVNLQPLLIPSLSPNSVLIRVHSSGKARWHGRKSKAFKSDNLVSSPNLDTYLSLRDPARIFGRYFYKKTIYNSAELRETTGHMRYPGMRNSGNLFSLLCLKSWKSK